LIDKSAVDVPITKQCELLGVARATVYYKPVSVSDEDEILMRHIDTQFTETPFYGRRRMAAWLRTKVDFPVNAKRVKRLMKEMGLQAIYPKPNTSKPHPAHEKYPYLLRDYTITRPNEVWSADITYVRLEKGFAYLIAIIDWHSRCVLSWRLSNTLDTDFCMEALNEALAHGKPVIFNTDQGCQFTSAGWTDRLKSEGIFISMDGRGRALDNIFVERLWRTVKYEDIYPRAYRAMGEARAGLTRYFHFYNEERLHQSLNYRTPRQVHQEEGGCEGVRMTVSRTKENPDLMKNPVFLS
jgi:putative transposase